MLWFAFNLWSLTSWTTSGSITLFIEELWFAFNLWSLTSWTTQTWGRADRYHVVICFQSLIFDILNHYRLERLCRRYCCDLLSIFDLWHLEPLLPYVLCQLHRLWFAFNLWSLTSWTTKCQPCSLLKRVVICFQSLIFDILNHSFEFHPFLQRGCDLLSIFDLWHLEPLYQLTNCLIILLWFAFNLWSLTSWTTCSGYYSGSLHVVICFQSLISWTTQPEEIPWHDTLWFAFNLWSLTSWTTIQWQLKQQNQVVICFQSLIFDILNHYQT